MNATSRFRLSWGCSTRRPSLRLLLWRPRSPGPTAPASSKTTNTVAARYPLPWASAWRFPTPPCCRPPGGHTPPSRLRSPLPLHNSGRPPSPTWHHHRPAPSQDSSPPARLKLKVEGASQPFDAPQSWPDHLRRKLMLAHTRDTPRWDQAAGGSFRGDFPFSFILFALGLLAIKLLNTPFSTHLKAPNRAQHNSTTTNKLQHHCTYLEHPKPTPTRS